MKVAAYAHGSYTHELALSLFPEPDVLVLSDPSEVIHAVDRHEVEMGLVPFYNLYARTKGVPVPYRLLVETSVFVREVIAKPIPLCLAAIPGTRAEEVEQVYMMEVLKPQCDQFLQSNPLPRLKQVIDNGDIRSTPDGLRLAKQHGRGTAAIGPARVAREIGLEILTEGIENPDNATFFFLIAQSVGRRTGRGLVCIEMPSSYSEEQSIDAIQDALSLSDYIVYDLWPEDRATSGESSQFAIVEVDPPDDGIGQVLIGTLGTEAILSVKVLGEIANWR